MTLRDLIGRNMLSPALRLMRAQLRLIDDPLTLREAARRVDAMAAPDDDARTERVVADGVAATWIDVAGARSDRFVLYLHGGAFITETPAFHGHLLARICREARARGLMPSYRLAPEHRYPAALDDCVAVYRWLLAQGCDAAHIVVAGDSAGGNLTLALLLRLRDEALPLPAGAVALSPVTDLSFSGDSVRRNDGIDDMFSADLMDAMVPVYLERSELRLHPHVSPLFGDYTGLPPLLLVTGSTELLLDDSVRVAQRWPDATLLVWHGMPHVFPGFGFLPEARVAVQRIGQFIDRRLAVAAGAAQPVDVAAAVASDAAAPVAPRPVPNRQTARPLPYLMVAVVAGLLWFAVLAIGIGPLLWLVHPLVWTAAFVFGSVWLVAAVLFVRAAMSRRPDRQAPGAGLE